jgi:hypothetical protein
MSKRKARFDFDEPLDASDDEVDILPNVRLRHTAIDLREDGRSGRMHITEGPASPRKRPAPSHPPTWVQEGPMPEINIQNYPFLDPAYVHHLDVNEPGPPKRHRTASVSVSSQPTGS